MACGCPCGSTKKESQLTEIKDFKHRGCTDILFLLAFIGSWVVLFSVYTAAVEAGGDYKTIISAHDMQGRACGVDAGVVDKPYGAWPEPSYYYQTICVASCDHTSDNDEYMAWKYPSEVFAGYCLPQLNASLAVSVDVDATGSFEDAVEILSRATADLYYAWDLIFLSAFIAIVITFMFTAVLRRCAMCITMTCIALICLCGLVLTFLLYDYAMTADESVSPDRAKACLYLSYFFAILTALFMLFVCALSTQIRIAVNVVEEAAHATNDMKSLIFFPIFPIIISLGYFAFWILVALTIASVSSKTVAPTPEAVMNWNPLFFPEKVLTLESITSGGSLANGNPANCTQFATEDQWRYAGAFHFFHLLWNIQFLYYFGYLVFAGATADWYFTASEGGKKKRGSGPGELSHFPVLESTHRVCRFHMGTVALCAFIIAVIQFVRVCVKYIEEKTKGSPPNQVQKAIFCVIHCCLYCLECCMDKVNKNALIWTAIWGDSFATAACSSFQLLWRNLGRVAAINVVSGILLSLTKMACAMATTCLCAMILMNVETYKDTLSSPVAPCVMIFLISFSMCHLFMAVFHAVIDTVFLCFLVDAETNEAGCMMASPGLQKLVGKYEQDSKKAAKGQSKNRKERPGKKEDCGSQNDTGEGEALAQEDCS